MDDGTVIDWAARLDDLRRHLQRDALHRIYEALSVTPEEVLAELRRRGLPARDLDAVRKLATADIDPAARHAVARARRAAALGGVSLGLGGLVSALPTVGQLGVVLLRLSQTLSLTYGFDHRTQRGQIDLWKALARGLGVDREAEDFEGTGLAPDRRIPALVGRAAPLANPLALRLAQGAASVVAGRVSVNLARLVPVVGGGVGAVVSWRQVGRAGERMRAYFREAHAVASLDLSGAVDADVVR